MTDVASYRTEHLARPKPIPDGFLEDRRSVYWIDRLPSTSVYVLSKRQEELCRAKGVQASYQGDRPSPIWPVSQSAMRSQASTRVTYLSRHKPVPSDYQPERSVYTVVSQSAKSARASGRLEELAHPMPHKYWNVNGDPREMGEFNECITEVRPNAPRTTASARVEVLSASKCVHDHCRADRPLPVPVAKNALHSLATLRLKQLARPKSSRMRTDDYDPYKVSLSARQVRPSPRILELSLPLPRKVRQRKS